MKSFLNFFNQEFLALESIEYLDKTIFRKIINKDKQFSPEINKQAILKILTQQIENSNQELTSQNDKINLDGYDATQGQGYDQKKNNPKQAYLNPNDEVTLITKYLQDKNGKEGLQARNTIILNKTNYIYAICHHLISQGVLRYQDLNDAFQIGVLALIDAIDNFDIEHAPRGFTPYAREYIIGKIKNEFNIFRSRDLIRGRSGKVESLDAEISGDKGEYADKASSLLEKISGNSYEEPNVNIEEEDEILLLKSFLNTLPQKEAKAIKLYYGLDGQEKKTYEDIGLELGMTKMGARQVTERAIKKLKELGKTYKV